MSTGGRPIRFLVGVVGGWTMLRIAVVWNETGALPTAAAPKAMPRGTVEQPSTKARDPVAAAVARPAPSEIMRSPRPIPAAAPPVSPLERLATAAASRQPGEVALAAAARFATNDRPSDMRLVHVAAPRLVSDRLWQASAWIVARDGGTTGAAPISQLGGGQAGIRIDRTIGSGLALTGRLTTALAVREQEGAIGIAWQPVGSALRIVAEQRFAIADTRGGPALGASAGVSDLPVAAGFRLEAYGQAGVIARGGVDGYADAAARAFRPVARIDHATFDLGIGTWGAIQRGARRIDIGPSAAVRLPLPSGGARLQLDWRQRVGGEALPGSGPVLTLASDF